MPLGRFFLNGCMIVSVVTCAARAVQAQSPGSSGGHSGFHAAVGVGYGSAQVTCKGCDDSRESSPAVVFRLGGAVNHNVVLSGEVTLYSKEKDGVTGTLGWVNFVTQIYPNTATGFFLKAGVGRGSLQAHTQNTTATIKLETTSFGGGIGVGYDLRLGPSFSLTPYADLLFATKSEAKVNAQSTGVDVGANMIHIGLAASWR